MTQLALYSAGGFSRELLGVVRETLHPDDLYMIDDDPGAQGTSVDGVRVISYDEATAIEGLRVNVTLADPALRKRIVERLEGDGIGTFPIVAPTHRRYHSVEVAEGAAFADFTMVTANARIGRHFHCNIYSYVAHDCVVGDFVTFAPRVSLNGRIEVHDLAYVGSDATFLPGNAAKPLIVGEGAVVGAGAVVTKDVEPYTVVVGAPAKPIKSLR